MRQTTPAVQLTLRDDPSPTTALRAALDDLGARYGLSESELFDLKVAATEALTNAIKGSAPGCPIDVAVEPRDDAIEIAVCNTGSFEPGAPIVAEGGAESGRGIPLMLALVDEVEFSSSRGGTLVRMRKRLGRPLAREPRFAA